MLPLWSSIVGKGHLCNQSCTWKYVNIMGREVHPYGDYFPLYKNHPSPDPSLASLYEGWNPMFSCWCNLWGLCFLPLHEIPCVQYNQTKFFHLGSCLQCWNDNDSDTGTVTPNSSIFSHVCHVNAWFQPWFSKYNMIVHSVYTVNIYICIQLNRYVYIYIQIYI